MVNEINSVDKGFLIDEWDLFFEHLLEIGYSETTIYKFKSAVKQFKKFMIDNNINYSKEAAENFLKEASIIYSKDTFKTMNSTLCRFDSFTNGKSLASRRKRETKKCPEQFDEIFSEFIEYLKSCGFRARTIEDYQFNLIKVLKKFDECNVKSIELITAENIYSLSQIENRKRSFFSVLRQFLRYLFRKKYLEDDYSFFVPSFRYSRPVPSVYTKSETDKILNSIDLDTKAGKRNYAIILLALRLGIRTGDIVKLKITDIDFKNKEINFIQEKTQVSQHLELLPEIENALLSYISTARPDSDIPNIFLSAVVPIRGVTTSSIYQFISQYIKDAEIDVGERKKGAHALRMTFASELVAEKVPYDVVRKILGHEDPITIKHYVAFDIESLRTCAIEVPMPTGKLAEYLNTRLEVTSNEIRL
ncbi:tyrosine-type recombinase/integrase [Fusibacter sp. JL216-2]|uniref:tyrosine-type recombinase/integrase n=1 Tax=Fusibacter sp. JL216-2 TaxID=3071453 RepID=UPI003D339796